MSDEPKPQATDEGKGGTLPSAPKEPKERDKPLDNGELDEALEESFPASDPLPPPTITGADDE